jgi:hypothetical protein
MDLFLLSLDLGDLLDDLGLLDVTIAAGTLKWPDEAARLPEPVGCFARDDSLVIM